MADRIYKVTVKDEEKVLRHKAAPFNFKEFGANDIRILLTRMKTAMHAAKGIGLSANQIGLPFHVFIAEVPGDNGRMKFYAIFNSQIEKVSRAKPELEEGCLSVPGKYGLVKRHEEVTLRGFDKNGKAVKIKAWGLLAHVFQHETDHLNGELFIDKATELHDVPVSERLKSREAK